MSTDSSVHQGHRQRMRNAFLKRGLDGLEDHNVLELLLFYSVPRVDTNELAHSLIDAFGSLNGVFDASMEDLQKVRGVTENTAVLITMIPQLSRRYLSEKGQVKNYLSNPQQARDYLMSKFIGYRHEVAVAMCLDNKGKILNTSVIHEGSINAVAISLRKIIEVLINYTATGLILAHNHPAGNALPSPDDVLVTQKVAAAVRAIGVSFFDHIIVADNDYVSMASSKAFRELFDV